MSQFVTTCPNCRTDLPSRPEHAGKRAQCALCKHVFVVTVFPRPVPSIQRADPSPAQGKTCRCGTYYTGPAKRCPACGQPFVVATSPPAGEAGAGMPHPAVMTARPPAGPPSLPPGSAFGVRVEGPSRVCPCGARYSGPVERCPGCGASETLADGPKTERERREPGGWRRDRLIVVGVVGLLITGLSAWRAVSWYNRAVEHAADDISPSETGDQESRTPRRVDPTAPDESDEVYLQRLQRLVPEGWTVHRVVVNHENHFFNATIRAWRPTGSYEVIISHYSRSQWSAIVVEQDSTRKGTVDFDRDGKASYFLPKNLKWLQDEATPLGREAVGYCKRVSPYN